MYQHYINKKMSNIQPMWNGGDNSSLKGWSNHYNMPFQDIDHKTPIIKTQNGRIVGLHSRNTQENFMQTENNNNEDTTKNTILTGTISKSSLSNAFFSKLNMQRIQNMLRYAVYKASGNNYVIGNQNNTDLTIIMRAIYLQYAKHLPYQLKEQVYELNNYVIDFSLPKVLSEVKQHLYYVHDIQNLPVPLEHPKNLSSAGTRSLRSVTTTF